MKGDFTRSTFKPEKHYNGVRMQQGRLQLDADWNEQVDIQNHINQSLTQDLIGDSGAAKTGGGFEINIKAEDLTIAAGHIYVNGILCELEEPTTYTTQPDYPNPPKLDNNSYLAYLDVWERHITAIEDQKILEPALKGLDTATRTKTIWQVKLTPIPKDLSEGKIEEWIKKWKYPPEGTLNQDQKAYLTAATADGIAPDGNLVNPNKKNYRGSENQLYRVEIHTPGDINTAKFKWSRNNGTTVSAIDNIKGNSINIVNIGRDDLQSFKVNQWVEILDEEQELKNEPGMLLRLQKALNTQLDVVGNPIESQFSGNKNLKIRGWHDTDKDEIPVSANWFEIENGIYIKFKLDANATYKTGDYWLIPARAVTKDIDWNYDKSGEREKERSHGIEHHYCPLALVKYQDEKFTEVKDYRSSFPPLKNALDKTGDIMTGDLEIQANLYVTRKLVDSQFVPGKVGIGTTKPFQQLIIDSTGKVGIGYNEADQTAALAIQNNVGIGTFDPKQQLVINSGKVGIGYNETAQTAALAIQNNVGIGTFDPKQQLVINSGKVGIGYNQTDQTAALAIQNNVGIGTIKPNALLDIKTTTKDGSTTSFLIQNPDSSLFAVRDNGKVGIGIATPEQKLVINDGKVGIGYNEAGQTAALAIQDNVGIGTIKPNALLDIKAATKDGSTTSFLIQNPDSILFAIKDNGKVGIGYNDSTQTAALAIQDNVGIGTPKPNALLEIQSATKEGTETSFLIQNPDSSLFAIKNNGNVGIGIATPEQKLVINDGKVGIGYNEAGQTAALAIQDNVGIGTIKPNALLDIKAATKDGSTTSFLIQNPDSILFAIKDNGKVGIGYNDSTQTAALAIQDNVGIGTPKPNALLEIQSATKEGTETSFLIQNPDSSLFAIKNNGNVGIGIATPEQKLVINDGKVGIGYNEAGQTAALAIQDNVGIGTIKPNALLDIKAATKDGSTTSFLIQNPDSILFAIKDNGKVGIGYNDSTQTAALAIQDNVGIGTPKPNALLEIQSATKEGTETSFLIQNPDSSLFAIKNNGNVGIGIATPEQKLVINDGKVGIGYNDSTQTAALAIQDNVGIGTIKPNALLDIKTTTKDGSTTSFLIQNPDSSLFAVRDNGKVGIGIATPEQKLVINDGKVGIGYNEAGQTAALAIQDNVGIGTIKPNALLDIKTTTKDGSTTSFLIQNPDSSLFAVRDNGKVGIGIATPEQKLVINDGKVGIGYNEAGQTAALAIQDNVGIGTIKPNALLDIKAATKDGSTTSFLIQNPDSSLFAVKNDGQVGIGILDPKAKLEIKGVIPTFATGQIKSDRTNKITGIQTKFQQELHIGDTITVGTQPRIITDIDDDNSLTVNAAFDPDLPSNGTTFTYQPPILRLLDSAGKTQMIATNRGNVSIGNAFPDTNAKLFVDGDMRVNGKLLQNSSRELKENITELSSQEVSQMLKVIRPVKFTYKDSPDQKLHAGFISEDVPDLLTSSDKTSVSPVDIAAVLAKAVKDQQVTISLLVNALKEHQKQIITLLEKVKALESRNQ